MNSNRGPPVEKRLDFNDPTWRLVNFMKGNRNSSLVETFAVKEEKIDIFKGNDCRNSRLKVDEFQCTICLMRGDIAAVRRRTLSTLLRCRIQGKRKTCAHVLANLKAHLVFQYKEQPKTN
jgi:hypothetical protein